MARVSLFLVRLLMMAAIQWQEHGIADAHPGAVAEGRATCGSEYSTAEKAYVVPDIKEAWFLRRIATCEQPVFWTSFDVKTANQEIYIAAISPELARFKDRIAFNGILYGPGVSSSLPGLDELPGQLPAGVKREGPSGLGAAYMKSPTDLSSCDFVDENLVMRSFSDVKRGRCMEELYLDGSYKDALQADATSWSWWIYSFNHVAAEPGRYYLQTWLTDTGSGAAAQGKYEMTLGPWVWGSYASEEVQEEAQMQGTECSCAQNAMAYKENTTRLGSLSKDLFVQELPGGSCDASPPPKSQCITQARLPYLSEGSAVEWAGIFALTAGQTYIWTFHSYYYCHGSACHNVYPDPGIDVFVASADTLNEVVATADTALKAAANNTSIRKVTANGVLSVKGVKEQVAEHVVLDDPSVSGAVHTRVLLKPEATGNVAVITQHVPSEFMAHFLVNNATGEYIFPSSPTLYGIMAIDTSGGTSDAGLRPRRSNGLGAGLIVCLVAFAAGMSSILC